MKHAVTRQLYDYWDGLRAGRASPERADIDPVMIRGILSDTFILDTDEASGPSLFPIRLSGTRLNALLAAELKGWSMLTLFDPQDRGALVRIMRCVLDQRMPAVVGLKGAPLDHSPMPLEMILLPLRHHGKTHARMLGSIAPFDLPSWLGLVPIEHFSIGSLRFVETATLPAATIPTRVPVPHQGPAPKSYGPLVVHEGGRSTRPTASDPLVSSL